MENVIIVAILLAIVGGIVWHLFKSKKRGDACIGCPYSKQCGGKRNSCDSEKTNGNNSIN